MKYEGKSQNFSNERCTTHEVSDEVLKPQVELGGVLEELGSP